MGPSGVACLLATARSNWPPDGFPGPDAEELSAPESLVWPGADAQGAGVTLKSADPLSPMESVTITVWGPTFMAQGRANVTDPLPDVSVAMEASARRLTMTVNVRLRQVPDTEVVMVPPWPTPVGLTTTITVQGPGP
jgi:hypothetical protein